MVADAAGIATSARPLELLERALASTRTALAAVPGHRAGEPTPCADWDLADLLAHMVDGFTAAVEGSAGLVLPPQQTWLPRDPDRLARRLLDLGSLALGGWTSSHWTRSALGSRSLPADTVMEVAALEIAVHGWDVARVCAPGHRLPPELAAALLPVALRHVTTVDRPGRFGPPVEVRRRDPAALLLGHLGRDPKAWPGWVNG